MYETMLMCKADAEKFVKLFMEKVGTDYELNDMQDGTFYVFAFDMETEEEIDICRDIENSL